MSLKGTILAASVFSICAAPALSKEIPVIPADKVEAGCKTNNGVFMPPKDEAYGCITPNGTITVCGGTTEQHKKTCTVALVQGKGDRANMGQRLVSRAGTLSR